jgi:hypothetical protein
MKELVPSITFNLSRGLHSLVDQAAAKIARHNPGVSVAAQAAGDIVKQAIADSSSIPDEDLSAVEIARRFGILERPKQRRRA